MKQFQVAVVVGNRQLYSGKVSAESVTEAAAMAMFYVYDSRCALPVVYPPQFQIAVQPVDD